MTETTDADRAKATDLWNRSQADYRGIDAIAAALASERDRALLKPPSDVLRELIAAERAAAVADLGARVEAVAEELEAARRAANNVNSIHPSPLVEALRRHITAAQGFIARLRAAVTDTTGGTQ